MLWSVLDFAYATSCSRGRTEPTNVVYGETVPTNVQPIVWRRRPTLRLLEGPIVPADREAGEVLTWSRLVPREPLAADELYDLGTGRNSHVFRTAGGPDVVPPTWTRVPSAPAGAARAERGWAV